MTAATIHFSGHGFIYAVASVPQCADLPTLDAAIRAAHAAGCEVTGVFGTTGGLRKPEERRA